MSTDLRALLHDLAAGAPPIDNRIALADTAYTAGRRRRLVRHLEMSAAAAIVVIAALFAGLFLGPSPLAAKYGASSSSKATGYPTHIGRQWPVLDLPAKPGPIAGVLMSGSTAWAVSPSGHRWVIPGDHGGIDYPTAVSADGRLIAYLENDSRLVIRDLGTGRLTDVPNVGPNGDGDGARYSFAVAAPAAVFSTDDHYLAFSGFDNSSLGGDGASQMVVDVRRGLVVASFASSGNLTGWAGDRLVSAADEVSTQALTGGPAQRTTLHPTRPLTQSNQDAGGSATSSDGREFVYLTGGGSGPQTVSRYDLTSGAQLGPQTVVPAATDYCGFSAGDAVVYNHVDLLSGAVSVMAVSPAGTVSTVTTIDSSLHPNCGVWASSAYDGAPRSGLILDRLTGLATTRWTVLAWLLGVVAAGLVCVPLSRCRWVRRRRRARDLLYPQVAREPWSRRRKVAALSVVSAPVLITMAVLTPLVFLPMATGDLVIQAPAVWWSPADAAAARLGAVDGLQTTEIPIRSGQVQGYVVRVSNHTSRAQTILGDTDVAALGLALSATTLTMSTSDGGPLQARSLNYAVAGTIPAHRSRWVRFLWTSVGCFEPGAVEPTDTLPLRVMVGLTTRVETLALSPALGVFGPSQPPSTTSGFCKGQS